jgi:hypothetical protein
MPIRVFIMPTLYPPGGFFAMGQWFLLGTLSPKIRFFPWQNQDIPD